MPPETTAATVPAGAIAYMAVTTPDGQQVWTPVTCTGGQYFIEATLPSAAWSAQALKAHAAALKVKAAEAQAAAKRAAAAAKAARRKVQAEARPTMCVSVMRAPSCFDAASDADESSCFEDNGVESDFD